MSEDLFAVEKHVIISSKDRISMRQWRTHLLGNWERLMPENTRLLVLAGIHGQEDGRLGDREEPGKDGFVEDCRKQVEILKKAKKEQMDTYDNINIQKEKEENIEKEKEEMELEKSEETEKCPKMPGNVNSVN